MPTWLVRARRRLILKLLALGGEPRNAFSLSFFMFLRVSLVSVWRSVHHRRAEQHLCSVLARLLGRFHVSSLPSLFPLPPSSPFMLPSLAIFCYFGRNY